MKAPVWMNAVIADFGRAAGVESLAFGDSGATALKFSNGIVLRFEYTGEALVVSASFALPHDANTIRRLLSLANPMAGRGVSLRAGIIAKSGAAVVAVRMPERDVTLPAVNSVFAALWRAVEDTGGVR